MTSPAHRAAIRQVVAEEKAAMRFELLSRRWVVNEADVLLTFERAR